MKRIIFLIVVFNLCVMPCFVKAEELATFSNERGDVTVHYPKDWFVKEYIYNNPYSIFLSREKIETPADKFKVGVSIHKFYHQSWYLGLDNRDREGVVDTLLNEYFSGMPNPGKETTKEKISLSDGTPALKGEAEFGLEDYIRIRVYVLYAMKDDVMVQMILEAPSDEFEAYRQVFDEIIGTAEVFYTKGDLTDNALLDQETENFVIRETIDEALGKDFSQIVSSFNDAKAMNPNYAKTLFLMGGFFMQVANKLEGKNKDLAMETSQIYLNSAIEYYQKYPENYNTFDRNLNISQCYYLLGDIYYFYYDNKEEARGLYAKSVSYFDYPEAKWKLENYFN